METCLESLRTASVGKIYVVDNSRSDDMRAFCETRGNVVYIPSDNVGFGAGHNKALGRILESGESEYHLVLNSDVRFSPEVIDRILEFMDSRPSVGLVQPEIVNPDGTPQYTARLLPTPLDVFGRRFLPSSWIRRRNDRYLMKGADRSEPFEAPYFQGSFLFMRVSALKKTGLFDERFFMYPEDIDISRRFNAISETFCLPGISIVHDHRRASYRSSKMLWIHITNMIRYFNKWGWWHDPYRRKINRRCLSERHV